MRGAPQKVRLEERRLDPSAPPAELKSVVQELAADLKKLGDAHDHNDDTLVKALNGGISTANNALIEYRNVDIDMPVEAPWTAMGTLGTGWAAVANFPTPAYLMLPGGLVMTKGRVNDTGAGAGNPVFVLPAGYDEGVGYKSISIYGGELRVSASPAGELYVVQAAPAQADISAQWLARNAAPPHAFPAPWPVLVAHPWPRCLGLSIEWCRDLASGVVTTSGAAVADWEDIGSGQLRLNGVWGLQWGRRYKLRLRLSAEEE